MTYREKLLAIGTVPLCGLVDLDRAEQVAIEADAEVAGLRADAERIDAQWRDELRIYRESEDARIAGLEAEVSRLRADAERIRRIDERWTRDLVNGVVNEFQAANATGLSCIEVRKLADDLIEKARAIKERDDRIAAIEVKPEPPKRNRLFYP